MNIAQNSNYAKNGKHATDDSEASCLYIILVKLKKKIERTGKRTFLQFATACDITQTAWNKIKTNSAKRKTRKDIGRAFIWHN